MLTWYEPSDFLNFCGSFDSNFFKNIKADSLSLQEIELPCKPLDDLLDGINDIWLVKLDVEGLEYKAITGMSRIIKSYFLILLIEENDSVEAIVKLMSEYYDLRYYDELSDVFYDRKMQGINYWLIPKAGYRTERVQAFYDAKKWDLGHTDPTIVKGD